MDTTQLLGTKKNETPPLGKSRSIYYLCRPRNNCASFNALQDSCQQVHAYYSSSTLRI